ncbi:MAG: SWF/SNF family helicase [Amphiamblys sp. WSBS2006]|nr:MAG: SWF/SNF family helicase [Amphiamblys sp. WSBS2006]
MQTQSEIEKMRRKALQKKLEEEYRAGQERRSVQTKKETKAVAARNTKDPEFEIITKREFQIRRPTEEMKKLISKMAPGKPKAREYSLPLEMYFGFVSGIKEKIPQKNLIPDNIAAMFLESEARVEEPDLSRIGPFLLNSLHSFQKTGVAEGIKRNGRFILADDMGLGKTIQALALARYYRHEWPLLVVAPAGLVETWVAAVGRWYSDLAGISVETVKGGGASLDGDVNIIGYSMVEKHMAEMMEKRFLVVIADESHRLKNPEAKCTKALEPVMLGSKRAILLSGTPIPSRPVELFTQIRFIDPTVYPSLKKYEYRYCNAFMSKFGYDVKGKNYQRETPSKHRKHKNLCGTTRARMIE